MFSSGFLYLHHRVITKILFFTPCGICITSEIAWLSSSRRKYKCTPQLFLYKYFLTIQRFIASRGHFQETRPLSISATAISSLFSMRYCFWFANWIFPPIKVLVLYKDASNWTRVDTYVYSILFCLVIGYILSRSYNSSWCWTAKLYRLSKSLGPRYSCFWIPLLNRMSVG